MSQPRAVTGERAPKLTISWPVQLTAVLALACYVRSLLWWTSPPDMSLFLVPWFSHIVHFGPIGAFGHPFSNYEPAYLYLLALSSLAHGLLEPLYIIKLLSIAGTIFLAAALADLLKAMDAPPRAAVFIFVLPTVAINDALLGQCDALWAGSCVLALAAMIRGNTIRSLVWCGIGVAFKSQAAFIAPVIIGAMIGRRPPLWQWAIPALVFAATLVPALLAGWPAMKLLMVYPEQAKWVHFAGRLANPWMFGTMFANLAVRQYFIFGYAAAAAAAVAIAALARASFQDRRIMLALAVLSATALPFLLPKMLERYYFLADVLALALAISFRSRLACLIALTVQSASLLSLLTYILWYHHPYPTLFGSAFAATALAAICVLLRQTAARWSLRHRMELRDADPNDGFRVESAPASRPASAERIAA
jgi:Gpi18-like mannosyltransferase